MADRVMPSVTNRLLIMYGILHYVCYSSCVQLITGLLRGRCERLFVTDLAASIAHLSPQYLFVIHYLDGAVAS